MRSKAFVLAASTITAALVFAATVAVAVNLPSEASPTAADATQGTTGADVTGHPTAEVNGVPPGPPTWLNESAPYGPPEWTNTSGGTPTWLTPA